MSAVDVDRVAGVFSRHLDGLGLPVELVDDATGEVHAVRPDTAAAADGLLPAFLAAADAVWREASGRGLGVCWEDDPAGLLGRRVAGVSSAPFSVVLLCLVEATDRVSGAGAVAVNGLAGVAQTALHHAAQGAA